MPPKLFTHFLQLFSAVIFFSLSPISYSKILIVDDWIINDSICQGCYKQAQLPNNPENLVEIKADQASFAQQGTSSLHGNVQAYYNKMSLRSKHAEVERANKQFKKLHLSDGVRLEQKDFRIDASKTSVNLLSKYTIMDTLEYRLYNKHARGYGSSAELHDQNLLIVKDGSYTTCAPKNDTWLIQADKFVVNRSDGMAQAYNAKLYVKNVPVFFWPYVSMPIDKRRKTGFLQPSIGSSSKYGKTFSAPVYFNLASNYDLVTDVQFLSKHGLKLDNEFRYINDYVKKLDVQYDFLPYDKHERKYRSRIKVLNNTILTNNFNVNANYSNASDKNYYDDFQPEVANTLYALQQADLNYVTQSYSLTTEVRQYKTFHSSANIPTVAQYRKLPEVTLNIFPILKNNFLIGGAIQYTNFQNFQSDNLPAANRYYGQFNLSSENSINGVKFKPGLKIDYVSYKYNKKNKSSDAQYLTPIFDLHSDISLARFKLDGFGQILQPRLYYVYVPKVKRNVRSVFDTKAANFNYHQLFHYTGYDGIDLIDHTNQVSMALESKTLSSGNKESLLGAGIRYNFLDKKFSSLAATYQYYFNEKTSMLTDVVFNSLFSINLQHKLANDNVFNIGYAYDTQLANLPLNQVNFSAAIPINNNLNTLGKFEYDFKNKHIVSTALGFEYQTCCLAFRVIAERVWQPNMPSIRKYDNQFKFQIIFKGLTGLGTADNKHLSELVPGYTYQDKW